MRSQAMHLRLGEEEELRIGLSVQTDGDKAVMVTASALSPEGSFFEATESSVCATDDRFNLDTGIKMAVGRALRQLGRDMIRDAFKDVAQQDRAREAQAEARKRQLAAREAAEQHEEVPPLPPVPPGFVGKPTNPLDFLVIKGIEQRPLYGR